MIRPASASLIVALVLAAGGPASAQAADHLAALAGTWTCRGGANELSTLTFHADGNAIVADETGPGSIPTHERYEPDGVGWRVNRDTPYTHFTGHAAGWTDSSWIVDGKLAFGGSREVLPPSVVRYELLDANTFSRTFGRSGADPAQGEICARGSEPPNPAVCPVHDVPAIALRAAPPGALPRTAWELRISGQVRVLVSLDADSKIVATSIVSSPSALLNADAVSTARLSTYRTAYHDCKPVPSKYIFAIDYSAQ